MLKIVRSLRRYQPDQVQRVALFQQNSQSVDSPRLFRREDYLVHDWSSRDKVALPADKVPTEYHVSYQHAFTDVFFPYIQFVYKFDRRFMALEIWNNSCYAQRFHLLRIGKQKSTPTPNPP